MSEQPNPIPADLSEAFHEATWLYDDWSPALPELEASVGRKSFSMSAICSFLDTFTDRLPNRILDRLFLYMHAQHRELKERLGKSPTYSTGAYCLLKLIEDRKAEYQRLEELRRNR
jgi:hypothetical protein